ncbi:MAG TPA: TetR/AcrR family transcriptional regulator, partial [Spirochaetes bacterium]|nr:TetR/AcrR family transcriptional regulator [Spirochaetota bacterium]
MAYFCSILSVDLRCPMIQTASPSKKKILDAAIKHMLAKGYGATTVDEICKTDKLIFNFLFLYNFHSISLFIKLIIF